MIFAHGFDFLGALSEELGVSFLLAGAGVAVDGLEDFWWEVFGDFCFGAAEHEGFYAHAETLHDG